MPENYISKVKLPGDETTYDIRAHKTAGIYYAQVDSTSTSTNFTATIADLNIDAYYDGLTVLLYNGKVTSASGFTININGLGAKPSYSNMALGNPVTPTDPTRDTTIFNINYAMLFTYNSTRVSGGCWICYRGYDANTNTIGYQLRSNNTTMPTTDKFYRYRLLFTSADHNHWVPANTSTSTNATAKRDTIQRPIDPFGEIVWYGTTTAIEANANVTAAQLWQEYYGSYTAIGYSFNRTGAAQTMTANRPIFIKCAPQSDGSAIIDADTPYVQDLPNSEDGKIYIFLGRAYNATNFEILMNHPVYYYKDGAIRLWSNAAAAGNIPTKTSDLTNDGEDGTSTYVEASDLATVATSGSYNDLSNTPPGLFEVTINTTTYAQLTAAINNGQIPYAEGYLYDGFDGTNYNFIGPFGSNGYHRYSLDNTSGWTNDYCAFQVEGYDTIDWLTGNETWNMVYNSASVNGNLPIYADITSNAILYLRNIDSSYTMHFVGEDASNYYEITLAYDDTWSSVTTTPKTSGTVTNIATGSGLTGGPISSTGTISHADTSSQASSTNSGRTYIQSVGLDDFGHVTSLSTATETVTDTNTTYTLSGGLSSHKFTSTLTAGGSGSGTSTAELTLAAGSNVSLTDDTTNKKITIAATNTTYTFADGTTANTFKVTPSGGTAQTVNITPSVNAATQLTGVVPLANGGTGISAGPNSTWYTDNTLHPHFEVNGNSMYTYYVGPFDGITDVASALASPYVQMAMRSVVPVINPQTDVVLFNAIITTDVFADPPNPTYFHVIFPDAILYYNQIINGLSGQLTYDANDGLYLDLSTQVPHQPYWYTNADITYTDAQNPNYTITSVSNNGNQFTLNGSPIAITSDQVTRNTTDATIATNDKLGIFDASDSNKLKSSSITFDTTKTGTYLRRDGTWATPTGLIKVYDTTDIILSIDSQSSVIASGELSQGVIDDIIADSATHQVVIVDNNNVLQTQDPEKNHFIVTSSVGGQDPRFYAISTSYIFHAYYYNGHDMFEIYDAPAPSHSHGSITNEGTIQASNTPIATGDRLLIRQNSGGHITSSPIYFSANSGAYLRQDGAWSIPTGLVDSRGTDELGIQTTTPSTGLIMQGTVNQGTFNNLDGSTYYYVCMITDEDGEFTACPNLTYYFYERTTESNVDVLNYVSYDAANSRFVLLKIKDNDTFTISEISTGAQGDFVRYDTNAQGLTTTEQGNARTNIAAAASSHTHGNITNDGKIGTTANYAVYTTTGGALTASAALPTATTNATIAALPVWSAAPTDTTYLIRQDTGGTSSFGRVPFSTVNTYIKSKNPALNYITYDSTEDAIKFVFPS